MVATCIRLEKLLYPTQQAGPHLIAIVWKIAEILQIILKFTTRLMVIISYVILKDPY